MNIIFYYIPNKDYFIITLKNYISDYLYYHMYVCENFIIKTTNISESEAL